MSVNVKDFDKRVAMKLAHKRPLTEEDLAEVERSWATGSGWVIPGLIAEIRRLKLEIRNWEVITTTPLERYYKEGE